MGFTFAAPLALLGLLALPAIYWLLRVTPPAPREIMFPPVRLLRDLKPREQTPVKTPWPLLLLRLAIAALASFAMAGPVWNPVAPAPAGGPLLVALDDGWAAAPGWERRVSAAAGLLESAERTGMPVALMLASEGAVAPRLTDGARAAELLRAARPKPWLPDRGPAATQISAFASDHKAARLVWIADGLEQGGAAGFASALNEAAGRGASVEVLKDEAAPLALQAAVNDSAALEVSVPRAGPRADGVIEALDDKARTVARAPFQFGGSDKAKARFELPVELRNEISSLRIAGENSAGAVALLDSRGRVRRVAIVGGAAGDAAQPLLSASHYLEKALAPFTLLLKSRPGDADPVLAALADRPNMLVLADEKVAPGEAFEALSNFVEQGGVLLRFAGPRLANDPDDLTPVRLRRNGRVLGGAMSWDTPKRLANFDEASPFFGLAVPTDVAVNRQILAEPDPGLSAKTWARTRRRHAARDLRAARQGRHRLVPCRRRRELVESAAFRAFRRHAKAYFRAVERGRGRARGERSRRGTLSAHALARARRLRRTRRPARDGEASRRHFFRTRRRRASSRILRRAGRRSRPADTGARR